jgi:hypothetical protein
VERSDIYTMKKPKLFYEYFSEFILLLEEVYSGYDMRICHTHPLQCINGAICNVTQRYRGDGGADEIDRYPIGWFSV